MTILFIISALCLSFHPSLFPPAREHEIPILVSPQVELFSTIHRLAGTGQYDEHWLPAYTREVEKRFTPFRKHRAVRLAVRLRGSHHLDGNSPMALASYLNEPPALRERARLIPPPDDLDPRWTADSIPIALDAAREFARDTDFMAFFQDHQPFYQKAVENLRSTLRDTDILTWFEKFFGYRAENYVIILGLQNGTCNYGQSVTIPDGTREFISILGARDPGPEGAPRYPENWFIPIIVHEFCHSYINPIVDRNRERLKDAGRAIFPRLKDKLRERGYNFWHVMMYEYLVRACTIRYLAAEKGAAAVHRQISYDTRAGFPGIQKLSELLIEYEKQRDRYPDLDSFIPRIADYFEDLSASLTNRAAPPAVPVKFDPGA